MDDHPLGLAAMLEMELAEHQRRVARELVPLMVRRQAILDAQAADASRPPPPATAEARADAPSAATAGRPRSARPRARSASACPEERARQPQLAFEHPAERPSLASPVAAAPVKTAEEIVIELLSGGAMFGPMLRRLLEGRGISGPAARQAIEALKRRGEIRRHAETGDLHLTKAGDRP